MIFVDPCSQHVLNQEMRRNPDHEKSCIDAFEYDPDNQINFYWLKNDRIKQEPASHLFSKSGVILNVALLERDNEVERQSVCQNHKLMFMHFLNRTYLNVSLWKHVNFNDTFLSEEVVGVFEFNYQWNFKKVRHMMADYLNQAYGFTDKFHADRLRFFDKDQAIISFYRYCNENEIDNQPLRLIATSNKWINLMAIENPTHTFTQYDKLVERKYKAFGPYDILNADESDYFYTVIDRKCFIKDLQKQHQALHNTSSTSLAMSVDRKSNVIIGFIKRDTQLQLIVGSKDDLHLGQQMPPIIRIQELTPEEVTKINSIGKSSQMCMAIVQILDFQNNPFNEQFIIPFDFNHDKNQYLYEAINVKLKFISEQMEKKHGIIFDTTNFRLSQMNYTQSYYRSRTGRLQTKPGCIDYQNFEYSEITDAMFKQLISEGTIYRQTWEYYRMEDSAYKFAYFGVQLTIIQAQQPCKGADQPLVRKRTMNLGI